MQRALQHNCNMQAICLQHMHVVCTHGRYTCLNTWSCTAWSCTAWSCAQGSRPCQLRARTEHPAAAHSCCLLDRSVGTIFVVACSLSCGLYSYGLYSYGLYSYIGHQCDGVANTLVWIALNVGGGANSGWSCTVVVRTPINVDTKHR